MGARQSNVSTTSSNLSTNAQTNRRTASQSSARAPHSHAHRVSSASVGFFNPGLGSHSDPGDDTYSSESRRRRQSLGTVAELSALAQNTFGPVITPPTLPLQLLQFSFNEFKCPFCSKNVIPDDADCHLVMCLTKPQISYNEDVLTDDKGECVICLEELEKGHTIARLPCLCIYHKTCIDSWFQVNRSCPEHPSD